MKTNNIHPNYITGISDGDGNFNLGIYPKISNTLGWTVKLRFLITAGNNPANLLMLQNIQKYFGGIGHINFNSHNNSYNFTVNSFKEL